MFMLIGPVWLIRRCGGRKYAKRRRLFMNKSRLFGVLLSLALMLGLMPGMNLTAYAATSHGITINSAQHGSVSASVNGSAATSAEEGATVTLTASPENGYRLKSISGTYEDYPNETIKYGATGGTHFNLTSFKIAKNQWCLWGCTGDKALTITSKDNKTIDRLEIPISWKGSRFKSSVLYTKSGEGTLSVTGNTIFVTSINKTGLSIYSKASGENYGCYANSVKIYYKDGTSTCTLNISATDDKNVRKFTMPVGIQGNVSITAEFEEVPKYSVTITPGSNMTKTTDSGVASQTDLSGAMEDVVYTANDGYYFPTDYSVTAVNGISVTRNSYTQITVSGTPTADAAISLTAPTAKTTPDAPTTAAAVDCTTVDNNDGKLTGVTTAMEYRKSDAADWTAGTGSDITGLVPGTYYVRVKATETTNASGNQELTIKGFISYTVTFKVVNGKWNDETTADKTVTLTGHDGDTLKLTADQIPAVGTKPNDTYKAGSWDTTPSADTEITGATTYTYTYAAKEASVVTKAPTAKTLTYTGSAQALVTAGEATGGTMQYAIGDANEATQPYTTSIPTGTDMGTYYVWYKVQGDDNHNDTTAEKLEVTINAPAFGTPDFIVPSGVQIIGENAFEGASMKSVRIPNGCTAIGAEAFKDCTNLEQISIPRNCAIGAGAFEGCGTVFIFAPSGSAAETYCSTSTNCVFIAEDHN